MNAAQKDAYAQKVSHSYPDSRARQRSRRSRAAVARRPKPPVATEQKIPVRTSTVETRDLTETLTLTGSLEPRAQVPVVAEVAARLMRVLKDEGDRVAQGAVIAVLDDSDFRLARDRAKAALDLAEANRAHARVRRGSRRQPPEDRRHYRQGSPGRAGGRSGGRCVPRAGAHRAGDCRTAARAHAGQGAAFWAHRQAQRPMRARCSRSGARSSRSWTMAVFEFRASVASSDFARVRVGEEVTVTVDALPGFSAKGQVTRIVPIVDPRSRSFEVVVRIPGQPQLVSGLFARADIHVRDVPGGLTVPPAALVRDGADPAAGPGLRRDRGQGRSARRHRGRRAARCGAGDERPAGRRSRGGRSACGARSRHSRWKSRPRHRTTGAGS